MRIGNEIVTASALGKRRRMFRIFGDKGKCIVVPLDDNLISKYNEGLKNLHDKIKDIQQAKPNGVLCYLGTASIIDKYEVPIILNLTASTEYKTHTKKILVSTIEQAIAIDAAAVAVHINVSSSYESIMLENLGAVSEVCQKYGMPLLVIVYPRTEHAGKDYNYEDLKKENEAGYTKLVCHCVRIAFELGADIIKTQFTGSAESFSKVVEAANGTPVLIAGGKMKDITEYSKMLYDINRDFYIVSKDSHGPHDLFVTYAKKEIEKLNSILSKAANQKEFSISSDYIVNANGVFDAFSQVTGKKVLKMTFPIWKEDNAIFTSQADIHFFEVLKLKMDSKEVDGVEVILIYDDKKLLDRSDVKKLLNFFSAEEGYTCKVALLNDFKAVCESNGVSSQFVDFGIYGSKMLYITEQYLPIHKGTYYKDETRVRHYTRLFDEVWNSDVITKANPSNNTTHVELAEIIR